MTLHLVRHGRPIVDPATPAAAWELDPTAYDQVWALRDRLPADAAFYTSPEPKAVQTAQLLTDAEVGVIEDLREQDRAAGWIVDFAATVQRAVDEPAEPAVVGWEPLGACRARVVAAVRPILSAHAGEDVVLVGHGTAWTVLVAELTGRAPDLVRMRAMAMPDLLVVHDVDVVSR